LCLVVEAGGERRQRRAVHVLPEELSGWRQAQGEMARIDADVRKSGIAGDVADLGGIVDREDRPQELRRLGPEAVMDHFVEGPEEGRHRPGGAEDRPPVRGEDASDLLQRRHPVDEELQARGAQHGVVRAVGKREVLGLAVAPLDRRSLRAG